MSAEVIPLYPADPRWHPVLVTDDFIASAEYRRDERDVSLIRAIADMKMHEGAIYTRQRIADLMKEAGL